MKTKKDIHKIEVLPSNALMKNKKGMGPLIIGLAALGLGVIGYGAWQHYTGDDADDEVPQTLTVTTPNGDKEVVSPSVTTEVKDAISCDGIASVKLLYNDINAFKTGTDPGNKLEILSPSLIQVADDATSTTGPVMTEFSALAGNTAGTPLSGYFAKPITFETVCSDVNIQPELKPASAPTITVTNDNGKTVNSDTNHEAMDASSTYSPCITVKAPAEACSSEYGAIVAFEYDATYVNKLDSSDLSSTSSGFQVAHETNHSGSGKNLDQYKVMQFNGELCDGDKVDICFDVTTTSSAVGEDQGNVKIHWYPLNYDLDADDYTIIGPAIYDEDNNIISQGNTTARYYTA